MKKRNENEKVRKRKGQKLKSRRKKKRQKRERRREGPQFTFLATLLHACPLQRRLYACGRQMNEIVTRHTTLVRVGTVRYC